ncbi:hypothetical protein PoB_002870100 [Plakobranchus ocellatus]|uniref:Uncharacterized protein n=1 Tax=Plakobranchus ocellatus TaxID=259542 RepID=A0AAV4A1Z7_9GAST|nr:hypothetical protein PoB_002870100 [Plakobranchus ocellatus]
MYPNATLGLMPFVKPAHKRQAAKKSKMDKADLMKTKASDMKTYKVVLRDRNGFIYTYIIQADPTSNSNPVLCSSTVAAPKNFVGDAAAASKHFASSLPNIQRVITNSPESRRHSSCLGLAAPQEDLTKMGEGEKKGVFNWLGRFMKKLKTSKSPTSSSSSSSSLSSSSSSSSLSSFKSGKAVAGCPSGLKSKRKPKANPPRKRQRKISAMSNLDPIQESPEEEDTDSDSYTHESSSDLNLSDS